MGNVMRRETRPRVLLVGPESSGKTALLYRLTQQNFYLTVPTIGVTEEPLSIASAVDVTMWDVGGLSSQRKLWQMCFSAVDIVVFVLDASCTARVLECHEELQRLSRHEVLSRAPLLILANKQDKAGAVSALDVAARLDLGRTFMGMGWTVLGTSSKTGQGLTEVLSWLKMKLKCQKKDVSRRRRRNASLDIQDLKRTLSSARDELQPSPALAALAAAEKANSVGSASIDGLLGMHSGVGGVFEDKLSSERERKKIRSIDPAGTLSSFEFERQSSLELGKVTVAQVFDRKYSRGKGGDADEESSSPTASGAVKGPSSPVSSFSGNSQFSFSSPRPLSPMSPVKPLSRSSSSDVTVVGAKPSDSVPQTQKIEPPRHFPAPLPSKPESLFSSPAHFLLRNTITTTDSPASSNSFRSAETPANSSDDSKIDFFLAKAAAATALTEEGSRISPSGSRGRLPSVLEDEELVLKEDAIFIQSVVDNRNRGSFDDDEIQVINKDMPSSSEDEEEEVDDGDEHGDYCSESDESEENSSCSVSPVPLDTGIAMADMISSSAPVILPNTCRVISVTPTPLPSYAY